MTRHLAILVALAALCPLSATADEIWDSDSGEVVYLDEIGRTAAFAFTTPGGVPARLIIPDLAGNYDNRATHSAIWVADGPASHGCGATMVFGDTISSDLWGGATIRFDKASFPTSFTLTIGTCFGEEHEELRAETTLK